MFNKDTYGKILVPIVTPFKENGDVDYDAMVSIGNTLLEKGWADSFILTGTTGEFFTMNTEERIKIFETMFKEFNGRIPMIAGTGAASTRETLVLTKAAERIGFKTVMIVAPYYTRPSQREIMNHFQNIARNVSVNVIIYNIPIFTGVNTTPETVAELAKEPNIVAIKEEAELNAKQITDFINCTPDDFIIYNGDDTMVLESYVQGFERIGGVISGGAHLAGDQIRKMIDFIHEGKIAEASLLQRKLFKMYRIMGQGGRTNPVCLVKEGMKMLGYPAGIPRLPMLPGTEEEIRNVRKILIEVGALKN
ncbi:MAG: 4-hydroxy-tetrahydrodipicolinate synthase [Peptostreptococcaceae bacterium]|nr:4-hydroxy-tetrahydrodipicolinate synthase [Peptostreptococcaceae bacterium]